MLVKQLEIRPATAADIDVLVGLSTGPIAGKRAFIAASVAGRTVMVATHEERVVGYIVWDHEFFGRAFVWLLGVDAAYRRHGVAAHLIGVCESRCAGESMFVSTNASNVTMRALLTRLGFKPSGQVDNLDPGDPELFFHKVAGAE